MGSWAAVRNHGVQVPVVRRLANVLRTWRIIICDTLKSYEQATLSIPQRTSACHDPQRTSPYPWQATLPGDRPGERILRDVRARIRRLNLLLGLSELCMRPRVPRTGHWPSGT